MSRMNTQMKRNDALGWNILWTSQSILKFSKPTSSSLSATSFTPPSYFFIPYPSSELNMLILPERNADENDLKSSLAAGDSKPPNGTLPKSGKGILLEYVQTVEPGFMELFIKRAPQQAVDAMRQTVTNMIGTLPPQFFAVTVITVTENLAQLMYSVLMTGYMFRNTQYRLELQQSLEQVALPEPREKKTSVTETSAPELAKLLYWLMVVGYGIRNIEVCFDMERVLGAPPKLAELPPG
ncbi:uncharacterized protein [Primulina huaijiensis]|uniref:uncharacterized protein n=1 Tax=Primulina huaijiensis TaxID=1492673 RepID=UPI003CC70CA4